MKNIFVNLYCYITTVVMTVMVITTAPMAAAALFGFV